MLGALKAIYPHQCLNCGALVESEHGLCGSCWRDTPFIMGRVTCQSCSVPLLGEDDTEVAHCDACLENPPLWERGVAALEYAGLARRFVLQLKHGGREDIAATAALWMVRAGRDLFDADTLLVPIPLHWTRRIKRRYNQAALLAWRIAAETGAQVDARALLRPVRTRKLDHMSPEERFDVMRLSLIANPARNSMAGRHVLLIDDVMTSGATLTAATRAALDAGAKRVDVLTLARAVRDP